MTMWKRMSRVLADRYCRVRKKKKSQILDEFVKTFGYNRSYASWLLRMLGRKRVFYVVRKRYIVIGERRR
ncbi:MAG: hypothetical protein NC816_01315 [Candidatus Omnitrophica bacterium]|nr:hypothetical protein [Candidatus Omnitrophota bacterium]